MHPRIATLEDGPVGAPFTIVLAHGAGAPMDSPFMHEVSTRIAAEGSRCVRFEFPYMAARREDGKRRPPNPQSRLLQTWRELVLQLGVPRERLLIGGKSMGGRMASLLADELEVAGVVCLGYPFHPAGKPERLRTAHLLDLRTPTLIVQGERDPLGRREEVESYDLSACVEVVWAPDGDHDLKPRKASGHSHEDNLVLAVRAVTRFLSERPQGG
ncbi:MAG: alpha/beta family hydrolase [Pseudomonadota bacterium]